MFGWFVFAACFIGVGITLLIIFLAYQKGREAGAVSAHAAFSMIVEDLQDEVKTAQKNAHAAETEARLLQHERDHWKGVASQDGTAWTRVKHAYENAQRKAASDLFNMERRAVRAETERERLLAEVANLWTQLDAGTNKPLAHGEKPRDTLTDCKTLPSAVGAS